MMWSQQDEDLLGTGNSGAHGGSMLSSLGGVIRLGELVPGGTIRHALKVNLFGRDNYYTGSGSYRWPATTADGCAPGCYGGGGAPPPGGSPPPPLPSPPPATVGPCAGGA